MKVRGLALAAGVVVAFGLCNPVLARDTAGDAVSRGWALLQKGDAEQAAAVFRPLTTNSVRGNEATLGLAYALERLGRTEDSLAAFERLQAAGYRPEEVKTALIRLRSTQAWQRYEAKDYAVAEEQFRWLHQQVPQDAKVEEGLTLSQKAQKTTPTLMSPISPYNSDLFLRLESNYRAGRVEMSGLDRYRTGTKGQGRLRERDATVRAVMPVGTLPQQGEVALTVRSIFLNSGALGSPLEAGRSYLAYQPSSPGYKYQSRDRLLAPSISWRGEGLGDDNLFLKVSVGTTPLGGEVSATVDASVIFGRADNWFVSAYHRGVDESLTSWAGNRDPWTGQTWGRVIRYGGAAGKTVDFGSGWWASGSGSVNGYYGHNIADNSSLEAAIAAGHTQSLGDGMDLTLGVSGFAKGYARNTNSFTWGWGGHFTPQSFTGVSPMARLRMTDGRDWWLDTQASLGIQGKREAHMARYWGTGSGAGLSPAALSARDAWQDGSRMGSLRGEFLVQGAYQLTPHLALGGAASLSRTSDFTEAQAVMQVQVFFEPRKTVSRPTAILPVVRGLNEF